MNEEKIINLLIAAISSLVVAIGGLVTAVVYMYKKNEKRESRNYSQFIECLNRSNLLIEKNIEMLDRVEKKANWRSH